MPQQIDIPGMGIVEFPDGMNDAQITAAIKQNAPQRGVMDKLLGTTGPRLQTLPERVGRGILNSIQSGVTLPGDVNSGKISIIGDDGRTNPEVIRRSMDLASMATPINPAARAGDKLIPGIAKSTVTEAPVLPTAEAIKIAGKQGFETAKGMGVDYTPAAVKELGARIEQQLQSKGILEEHAPTTYRTLARLREPPEGAVVTVSDLHNLRQAFGNAAGNLAHPKDTLAGSIGRETLDSFLAAPPAKAVVAGDAAAAGSTLKDAISNYASASRAEDVGARLTRAERQAAKAGSGSNIDNAIRQKISAILDVPSRTRGYSPEELAQMETVVRGTPTANIARKIGKLGVSDGLSLLLHAGAAIPTGGASIPIAVAGTLSRKIAEMLTQRGANKLDEMIRARSPLAKSAQPVERELSGSEQARRAAIARMMMGQELNQ